MRNSKIKKRNGFTLVEIMIVLLIIGIISSVLIPNYSSIQGKSKESAVKSVCRTLQVALESYNLTTGTYPSNSLSIEELSILLTNANCLSKTPQNPFTNQHYTNSDTSGKITYTYNSAEQSYTIHGFGTNNSQEITTLSSTE